MERKGRSNEEERMVGIGTEAGQYYIERILIEVKNEPERR
jgi:hypothetical protein